MRGATLLESRFHRVRFENVNLARTRLTSVGMSFVQVMGTRFEGAVLSDVTFTGARISDRGAGVGRPIATAGDLPGASLLNVRFE